MYTVPNDLTAPSGPQNDEDFGWPYVVHIHTYVAQTRQRVLALQANGEGFCVVTNLPPGTITSIKAALVLLNDLEDRRFFKALRPYRRRIEDAETYFRAIMHEVDILVLSQVMFLRYLSSRITDVNDQGYERLPNNNCHHEADAIVDNLIDELTDIRTYIDQCFETIINQLELDLEDPPAPVAALPPPPPPPPPQQVDQQQPEEEQESDDSLSVDDQSMGGDQNDEIAIFEVIEELNVEAVGGEDAAVIVADNVNYNFDVHLILHNDEIKLSYQKM